MNAATALRPGTVLGALGVPARGPRRAGYRGRPRTTTSPARSRRAVVVAVTAVAVLAVMLVGLLGGTGATGGTGTSSPVAVVAPAAPVSGLGSALGLVVAAPGAPGDCGFLDPAACVTDAINSLLGDAVTSAVNAGLGLLSATLLATPRVDQVPRVAELWASSWQLVLALYAMIVVLAAIGVMVAGVRGQSAVREALPRLLVGFLAGALSLPLSGIAITLANALSAGVLGEGLDPASVVNGLGLLLGSILTVPAGGGLGLIGLGVGLLVVIELGAVLVVFIARVVLTVLLVVGAPLALMFHALPQTEGIARWWWRAFAGVLAVQVLQSLTLITALRVILGPDGLTAALFPGPSSGDDVAGGVVNALVTLVLLWVLFKIPFWVLHAVRGTQGRRRGGGLVRTAVVAAAFSAVGGPAGLGAAAGRGGLGRLAGAFMGRAAGRGLAGLVGGGAGARGGPGGGRRPAPRTAGGPGPDPDPYARVQAERDGQLRLPLGPLPRSPRSSPRGAAGPGGPSGPSAQGGPGAGRASGAAAAPRGRQLRLPFDQPPPDPVAGNRPMRGGPNPGQYPLPYPDLTRQPRPAASPGRPPASRATPARGRRPAGRGVQLEFPFDPYRGNRPVRRGPDAGQYPLPLPDLTRRPAPAAPAPAPVRPPARRLRGAQLELPFDPYQANRALRGGQYPLPLPDLTRHPRPAPPAAPPPTPPPPARRRQPDPRAGRPGQAPPRPARPARPARDAQMPLPFNPPLRRQR